ncbi:MAG: RNA methyltransferase [Bacillota bacterium]|nr:RNA methyltransferase [Bacillota bacterium]
MNFKEIASKSNPYFKKLVQMKKNKASDEFFVEGARYIKSAYEYNGISPDGIVCEEEHRREAESLSNLVQSPLVMLTEELFGEVSETVHSQGILAVYRRENFQSMYGSNDFSSDFSTDLSNPEHTKAGLNGECYLVLDEVQDPGNVGAVIRTADAAGFSKIFLVKGTADPYSPKASRASAGSVLNVRTYSGTREEILHFLIGNGCDIVVTTIDGADYKDFVPKKKTALILGNEARGVHLDFVKNANYRVGIPMRGGAESLNVAVAAGILIYHLRG